MVKILGRGTSGNVQKVIWLLEELGQAYAREDYGRQFNNTQTEAYLALNPTGKVPTLVDGDVTVWESNTILRYLCNKSAAGTGLYLSLIHIYQDGDLGATLFGPRQSRLGAAASNGVDLVRRLSRQRSARDHAADVYKRQVPA